jgi:hypothetical protein
MAITWIDPPSYTATISAADDLQLRCPFQGVVCRWYITGEATGWTGSITIKSRPSGSDDTFAACEYYEAADEDAATAALTTSFWIWVDATARDIDIDCTSYTAGTMAIKCEPVLG